MTIREDWEENPPEDLDSQLFLLEEYADDLTKKTARGSTLRGILKNVRRLYDTTLDSLKNYEPQAFFKPSYEQALLLNAWFFGINFPICFSANRIGKTTAFVFNAILWIFPNNPAWLCFQPYIDHLGRKVEVLPRPPLQNMIPFQAQLAENPHLQGDITKMPNDSCNVATTEAKLTLLQDLLAPAWPLPPMQRGGTIWLGAPDNEFHKTIIMKRWKELLPTSSILRWSDNDRNFTISTASSTNPKTTAHQIICKSYESEDTKWSGDAVQGIVLTEGFTQDILDEVKNRITNEGFASWDYTPTEARNTGQRTALAYKVYKREEELPLRSYVFTKFSVRTAPEHIIPTQKREDLIRMWEGRKEGAARLEGEFFSSSGLILDKLNRDFHCLNWTLEELYTRYPNGRHYRAIDPGLDHPTACAWGYLSANNIWFIYRFYSKRGTTIQQRCEEIISLSNNQREVHRIANGQTFWREVHPFPNSEVIVQTPCDYHTFKEDETTGQNYALHYNSNGLIITPSIHMGPEERAVLANTKLDPQNFPFLAHPRTQLPPGARIFFLTSQPGVAAALDTFDQLFWSRYKSGENAGLPKDKVPIHGDDEFDALCELVCAPFIWTPHKPRRIAPTENENTPQYRQRIATLQLEPATASPTQEAPFGYGQGFH